MDLVVPGINGVGEGAEAPAAAVAAAAAAATHVGRALIAGDVASY
jgi:hypothetical protein